MANGNGKPPRENTSFSIDMALIPLLRGYCARNDRSQSDAVNKAIKILLALEKANSLAFWQAEYDKAEE